MEYLNMVNQRIYEIYNRLIGFLYKYSISVFVILFVIIAYILLLHIDHQQSALITSAVSQHESIYSKPEVAINILFKSSRRALNDTFIVLLVSFGLFLVILSFVIRRLRNTAAVMQDYADQTKQANEKLQIEVEERQRLAKELLKINRKQWQIAFFDTLTGLANRQLFDDRIRKNIAHAEREKEKLAILYLDLDGFKSINDTLGHNSGDELLQEIANRLKLCVRSMDTVARLGGDEFVVIITQLNQVEAAVSVANKILEEVAKPVMIKDAEVFVTASIGVVVYPDNAKDVETLIKSADLAMYKAKERGRNNYQFYDEKMMVAAQQTLALATEIYSAINSNDFVAYYQPLMDVKNNCVIGVEALVRWHHNTRGVISPLEFIETAEKNGLIGKIGDAIMQQACDQVSRWEQHSIMPLSLAVNFSVWQLFREDALEHVLGILAKNNIEPKVFTMEVTERALVKDVENLQQILYAFRDAGIQIAIDDFGVGYSALTYLHELPIDIIKLADSFTKNIVADNNAAVIVKAVIDLAKQLNIKVIAEGVETKEQKDKLEQLGCQYMQGFYWGEPKLAQEYDKFLRDNSGKSK